MCRQEVGYNLIIVGQLHVLSKKLAELTVCSPSLPLGLFRAQLRPGPNQRHQNARVGLLLDEFVDGSLCLFQITCSAIHPHSKLPELLKCFGIFVTKCAQTSLPVLDCLGLPSINKDRLNCQELLSRVQGHICLAHVSSEKCNM